MAARISDRASSYVNFFRVNAALLRQVIDRDAARRHREEGREMSEDEAIAYARSTRELCM